MKKTIFIFMKVIIPIFRYCFL